MSNRLFDRLELGARVAQTLVADNELSPASRHAAICWRAMVVDQAATAVKPPRAWRPAPRHARAGSGWSCAA